MFIVSSFQGFRFGWLVGGFGFGFVKTGSVICNSVGQQALAVSSAGIASAGSHHIGFLYIVLETDFRSSYHICSEYFTSLALPPAFLLALFTYKCEEEGTLQCAQTVVS